MLRYLLIVILSLLMLMPSKLQAQIESDIVPEDIARKERTGNYGFSKKHFYLIGKIGAAFPLGDFGSQDFNNFNASFAQVGIEGGINFGKLFSKNFGFTGSVGLLFNGVDKPTYEYLLSVALTRLTYNPRSGSFTTLLANELDYRGYNQYYLTIGPLITIAPRESYAVDFRLQAGVSYGVDRLMEFSVNSLSGFIGTGTINRIGSVSFMINPGANIRFLVSDRLVLTFLMDYYYAHYSFDGREMELSFTMPSSLPIEAYNVPMHNFTTSFGIGIYLD